MPLCFRRFQEHWFIDIFAGDQEEVDRFLARHKQRHEYTDEFGLNIYATCEALQVGSERTPSNCSTLRLTSTSSKFPAT